MGKTAGCWVETQAGIGQESYRCQPIASELFVARGYGHVIGPGVAEREGSKRVPRDIEKGSPSVLPLLILLRVILMRRAGN